MGKVMSDYGITLERLAQELATDHDDKQTWPRSQVNAWVSAEITVSGDGAFKAGDALRRLGANVCGPEAVFASGHYPAFIAFLVHLATKKGGVFVAARLAILPWIAYALGVAGPVGGKPSGLYVPMHDTALKAYTELRKSVWDNSLFLQVWKDSQQGREALQISSDYGHWAIGKSYEAFCIPSMELKDAIDLAFSYLIKWVMGLPDEAKCVELLPCLDTYEKFMLDDQQRRRRDFLNLPESFRKGPL